MISACGGGDEEADGTDAPPTPTVPATASTSDVTTATAVTTSPVATSAPATAAPEPSTSESPTPTPAPTTDAPTTLATTVATTATPTVAPTTAAPTTVTVAPTTAAPTTTAAPAPLDGNAFSAEVLGREVERLMQQHQGVVAAAARAGVVDEAVLVGLLGTWTPDKADAEYGYLESALPEINVDAPLMTVRDPVLIATAERCVAGSLVLLGGHTFAGGTLSDEQPFYVQLVATTPPDAPGWRISELFFVRGPEPDFGC